MSAKILVVDDSASDRFIIEKMLREYSVLTACDGVEAMRQINENDDIDLIILDLNMPGMDGFEVLNELKSDDRYKRLRAIILTNYDELDNEIKGLKLGAVDYIRKPINMHSLKARIEIHIELLRVQRLLEQKLNEQVITFDTVFQQAPIGIAISHSDQPLDSLSKAVTRFNPMFEQITGRTKEELIELGWGKITHSDDLEEDLKKYRKLKSGEVKSYSMEKRYIKPDGSVVWVYMTVAPLVLLNDDQYNHICLVQDITERKAIEADLLESERSKSVLLSHLPGMAYRCNYDREWTMQYVSDGCFELTGYRPENLVNNRDLAFKDLVAPEFRESLWEEWRRAVERRITLNYEYQIVTAKGERKWILEIGQGIYNELGGVEALEGIILDISDRKEIENNLRYSNEHDNLTGLYNRNYLESLLESDTKKPAAEKRALVSVNLSAVQSLTMTYGFHYTQELIKKVADTLNQYCTERRVLFSTHENRFTFYIRGYEDRNELVEFSETLSKALESLLAVERTGGGIGVIEIERDNECDVDLLMRRLLITSEKAIDTNNKDVGICFYDTEIEMQTAREEEVTRELTAIAADESNGGLFLQYQPILDLKSNRICCYEALARLNIEGLGPVPPLEFIPIAEKTKLIIPIGRKIMLQAFRFLDKLKKRGYETISVSINVSAIQLLRNDFASSLFEMIDEMQVNPESISLEITESVFTSNYEEVNRVLGELMKAGIHIAIDDFGTGYSSLSRERDLNVNCLKIDRSFISRLMYLKPEDAITGDIVSIAHKLGHLVVAEGVEHEKQREYLSEYGCDNIQGYLISRPLDEEAAIEFLKTYNRQR